jgi:hypothetical protein
LQYRKNINNKHITTIKKSIIITTKKPIITPIVIIKRAIITTNWAIITKMVIISYYLVSFVVMELLLEI